MIDRASLFWLSLRFSLSGIIPNRRQQTVQLLREISQDIPDSPCCEDILGIWAEQFGEGGLMLGDIALFAVGFLLMAAADILLYRYNNTATRMITGITGGIYCLFKFRSADAVRTFMALLFIAIWLLRGFWWSLAFLFLVAYTNIGVYFKSEGKTR